MRQLQINTVEISDFAKGKAINIFGWKRPPDDSYGVRFPPGLLLNVYHFEGFHKDFLELCVSSSGLGENPDQSGLLAQFYLEHTLWALNHAPYFEFTRTWEKPDPVLIMRVSKNSPFPDYPWAVIDLILPDMDYGVRFEQKGDTHVLYVRSHILDTYHAKSREVLLNVPHMHSS